MTADIWGQLMANNLQQAQIEQQKQAISTGLQSMFPGQQVPYQLSGSEVFDQNDPILQMQQYDPMAFVKNLPGIMPEQANAIAGAIQANPQMGQALLGQLMPNAGSDATAPIKNFLYRQGLKSPEDISVFDAYVRQMPYLNTGAAFVQPSITNPSKTTTVAPIQLSPSQQPDYLTVAAGSSKAGEGAVTQSLKAFEQITPVRMQIANYEEAIKAIDSGAGTGPILSLLPSVRSSSIQLDNVKNRLGLGTIAGGSFGALSEGELKFALSTSVPTNLQPAELKKWLIDKRNAQQKLADTLENAATYLGTPGNTVAGWVKQNKQQTKQPANINDLVNKYAK